MKGFDKAHSEEPSQRAVTKGRLGELARLFLKLGFVAFGGPAAHIAMLEDEVVTRRKWMSRQHMLDLIGATNLIPGPNSTEMVMHVGYERARVPGLLVAGLCFIGPAAFMTGFLGWLYASYGTVPEVEPFLIGIKPAVLAVIAGALWKLGKKAVKGSPTLFVGIGVAAAMLLGVSEVPALIGGGILGMLIIRYASPKTETAKRWLPFLFLKPQADSLGIAAVGTAAAGTISLWKLGLFFLKVGSVLYGSGYVLVAFLEGELVNQLGWLTHGQLLDAIAIGQFTPGPVLTTATFIGMLLGGIPGALVATVGIFLPAFVLVAILNRIIPKLRESVWLSAFLDAVNAAAVALMAVVTLELSIDVLTTWQTIAIALVAAVLAFHFKVGAAWLVVFGAVAGVALSVVGA